MSFSQFRVEAEKLVDPRHVKFLEVPRDEQADLAMPCFALAKEQQKNPNEVALLLAIELKNKLEKIKKKRKDSLIGDVRSVGPYVNFYIDEPAFCSLILKEILSMGGKYGSSSIGKGKVIVIDYSHPNIAKPMSVGHLRSTIIGQALYNLHKYLGYKVIGDNHIGDWGTQFGNLLCAYKKWGKPAKIKKNPIPELLKLYVKFHEEAEKEKKLEEEGRKWLAKLEKGNPEAIRIWKYCVRVSMQAFEKIYKRLGVKFDYVIGESFYVNDAKRVIREALVKGIAKKESGAIIIPMNGTPLVIQKSDESTLYGTRDLATIKYRKKKFGAYKMIYVVGSEQKLYFKQVFHAAQRLGYMKESDAVHVDFGLISLPGGRMSTRLGRVVFLEDFIDEAVRRALAVVEEKNPKLKNKKKIAEKTALAAIKYNDLSHDRTRNVVFDWTALRFEGDTGPYLQYTAVRANSILKKSKNKPTQMDLGKLTEKDEIGIAKHLAKFPGILKNAAADCKPHYLCNYLYSLADKFNEYYHKTRIIDSDAEKQRLSLVFAVYTVLAVGLLLLGIDVPDSM